MEFTYGEGEFREGDSVCQGAIILSEHKLFLKGSEGDLTQTYIPLEKIEYMKLSSQGLLVQARLTITLQVSALFSGDKAKVKELAGDIVKRRGLKKKFLKKEWVEIPR